jgi:hypothetical protein
MQECFCAWLYQWADSQLDRMPASVSKCIVQLLSIAAEIQYATL